ncbi:tetratricopeptide repeat protein [Sphaerothrix gracilis]|uniref:tetratricopeptide repeat protein n=1 Tax=Sphaerothrix gracilis TaxID=3151835 RepID=UPI0031FCED8E
MNIISIAKSLPLAIAVLALPVSAALAAPNTAATSGSKQTADLTGDENYDQYMRLGYAAQQREDYAAAATYFRNALHFNPNDRAAVIAYWNVIDAMNQDSQDLPLYDQYMEMGYDATDAGDYLTAQNYFQQALDQRPGDYYATQALRNVETYLARGEGANSTAGQAEDVTAPAAAYPGETPYDRYMRLGYAAQQQQEYLTARSYFRSALYERPNDRQATIAYWNVVDGLQDGDAGLGTLETDTEAYDRFMRLGYDATARGDYTRALNFFQQALEQRPSDYYATEAIANVQTYINR